MGGGQSLADVISTWDAAGIKKIAVTVTIDQAEARRQTFGMVNNAYVRIVDETTGTEVARYDLSEDYSVETALIFGELYNHNGEWKFKAIGQGFANGVGLAIAEANEAGGVLGGRVLDTEGALTASRSSPSPTMIPDFVNIVGSSSLARCRMRSEWK